MTFAILIGPRICMMPSRFPALAHAVALPMPELQPVTSAVLPVMGAVASSEKSLSHCWAGMAGSLKVTAAAAEERPTSGTATVSSRATKRRRVVQVMSRV